jgi:hypothetical protein
MKRNPVLTAVIYIACLLLFAALLILLQFAESTASAYYQTTFKIQYPSSVAAAAICLIFGTLLGLPRLLFAMREKGRVRFNPLGLFLVIPPLAYSVCYFLSFFGHITVGFLFDFLAVIGHIDLVIVLLGFSLTMLVKKEEYRSRL